MASGEKTIKIKWEPEAERALVDIWADILTEQDDKMVSRKTKEKVATAHLNQELKKDLKCEYSEKAVCNKIDSMVRKGKQMYSTYHKKGEMGKKYDGDLIDWESAIVCWPNFETLENKTVAETLPNCSEFL